MTRSVLEVAQDNLREVLEAQLKKHGSSQERIAVILGVNRINLNRLINGRMGISAQMAIRLEKLTGILATDWMMLQAHVDIARARKKLDTRNHSSQLAQEAG